MEDISLIIEGEVFKARKNVLCEHSDYFRAMFSGHYKENNLEEISIDLVDAYSMRLILMYMDNGLIDLTDFSIIYDLAISANFLQIGELMKQIEYTLIQQLSFDNWAIFLDLAEAISSSKLEQTVVAFGVLNFTYMKPDHIPTIQRLHWYLSHPSLEVESEFEVFKLGFDWVNFKGYSADALLIVLGSLDVNALKKSHLEQMLPLLAQFDNCLARKIVKCMWEISTEQAEVSTEVIRGCKQQICEKYTEHVYTELLSLTKGRCARSLQLVPCIAMSKLNAEGYIMDDGSITNSMYAQPKQYPPPVQPQFIHKFQGDKGFEKWLEISPSSLWGWSFLSWGRTKLVVVCGEYGKGLGSFMKEVAIYDTLDKEWIRHGVQLPARRHAGVAIRGNSLYIIGGVGTFRVVLCSCLVYDLEERSYRKIANLPDAVQNPAVCVHKGEVYASCQRHIYRYDGVDGADRWVLSAETDFRPNHIVSYGDYIYITQCFMDKLYRFKPNIDDYRKGKVEVIATFENPVCNMCNAGNKIVAFTGSSVTHEPLSVEAYQDETQRMLWADPEKLKIKYDVPGCCSLAFSITTKNDQVLPYARKYLSLFKES